MIRFQADADLRFSIVLGVLRREPAIDFQSAIEAKIPSLPDPEVLRLASEQGRVLVSHDAKTMPLHFAEFIAHTASPGVLIVPQHLAIAEAIDELVLIWSATDVSDWTNRICRLPL